MTRRTDAIRKETIRIGRKYPVWRINAYECEVGPSGVSYKLGKTGKPIYVGGWYGLFDEYRLSKIRLKLAEYAEVGQGSYPFLITQHRLKSKTTARLTFPKDIKFDPRKPAMDFCWCAVVLSDTEFKLLEE